MRADFSPRLPGEGQGVRAAAVDLPSKIGPYQIKRLLGAGAMGHVYLAHDPHLDRDVALKVLPRELTADEERVSRFLREARLTAKIQHPNTVVIHQVMVEEGLASIVMEFVDGGSLDEIVEKHGPMPWREATRAIRDAAAGLGAAHELGLVHRDVKPANLMRTGKGTVKVVDFGLVRAMQSTSQLTQMGTILGTPTYMAPKQWMGQEADARSDLYSLVCTYYFLLTGKGPFAADSIPALGYQHRYEPFPDARKVVSDLPRAAADFWASEHVKDPAERFQTAAELIAALDGLLAATDEQLDELPVMPPGDSWVNCLPCRTPRRYPTRLSCEGHPNSAWQASINRPCPCRRTVTKSSTRSRTRWEQRTGCVRHGSRVWKVRLESLTYRLRPPYPPGRNYPRICSCGRERHRLATRDRAGPGIIRPTAFPGLFLRCCSARRVGILALCSSPDSTAARKAITSGRAAPTVSAARADGSIRSSENGPPADSGARTGRKHRRPGSDT